MGRKTKYDKELKLEIIRKYLNGASASLLARQYGIGQKRGASIIGIWVRKYNKLGESGFDEYSTKDSLLIKDIYTLIPSELNNQNKRVILKNLNEI